MPVLSDIFVSVDVPMRAVAVGIVLACRRAAVARMGECEKVLSSRLSGRDRLYYSNELRNAQAMMQWADKLQKMVEEIDEMEPVGI